MAWQHREHLGIERRYTMHARRLQQLATTLFVVMISLPFGGSAQSSASSPKGLRVIYSTPEAIVLEFTLPDYVLCKVETGGRTFVEIDVTDLPAGADPGNPQLPQKGALIGLPPSSTPSLQILEMDRKLVALDAPIYPEPSPIPGPPNEDGPQSPTEYELTMNESVYARDELFPSCVASIAEIAWVRDHRVAHLLFYLVRYNPVRSELEVVKRVVVEISFSSSSRIAAAVSTTSVLRSPIEELLQATVLNYDVAENWKSLPLTPVTRLGTTDLSGSSPATRPNSYKLMVDADGLYRLTFRELQTAGIPVDDLDPQTLQILENDQEIAIQVFGESDGSFDPEDSIQFYGRRPADRYNRHDVYWLRYGDTSGLRMPVRSVRPSGQPRDTIWAVVSSEENRLYASGHFAAGSDHWFAGQMNEGDSYGQGVAESTIVLDAAILQEGGNIVTVSISGDTTAYFESVMFDAVELEYAIVASSGGVLLTHEGTSSYEITGLGEPTLWLLDITEPGVPWELEEPTVRGDAGQYTLRWTESVTGALVYLITSESQVRHPTIIADAPSNLKDETNAADYLLITHRDFVGTVEPLAAYHRAQGLRVKTIDVQDIYDEFNGGLLSPLAIRDFIAFAYNRWERPAPTYVLLVGDGNYDFLNHTGHSSPNYIPPYLATVDPQLGETASDNLYACVSGNDHLPDLTIGRLPVNSRQEAQTVIRKILDYEQSPKYGGWNAHHVFAADRYDGYNDFATSADSVFAHFVSDPQLGERVYLDDLSAVAARQDTLDAWDQGALLISFVGHGSWDQWTSEALLHTTDTPQLINGNRLPVLLSMACYTGFFHHPERQTLDESLLRQADGGAVATWSLSGLGTLRGQS